MITMHDIAYPLSIYILKGLVKILFSNWNGVLFSINI